MDRQHGRCRQRVNRKYRPLLIALKPREKRRLTASQIIDRLRPELAEVPGVKLFLSPAQDITVGGRSSRGSFQYTLRGTDSEELAHWSQKMLDKMRTLPEIADAATDLLADAPQIELAINRDQAGRFGISPQLIDDTLDDAYGQRQITQYFTQLNTYPVILEVPLELQSDFSSLDDIYLKSPLTGAAVPLGVLVTRTSRVGPLSINAPGSVSGGYAVVQSARRRLAGRGRQRDQPGRIRHRHARHCGRHV